MKKSDRTPLMRAAGQLVKELDRIHMDFAGLPEWDDAMDALGRGHRLLSQNAPEIRDRLEGLDVATYIGTKWVEYRPAVKLAIEKFESALIEEENASNP